MPAPVPPHGLADCQGNVEQKLREGESFSAVEDYINAAPLDARQQAALWLLAWAHQKPRVQLRLAKETLALVSNILEQSPETPPQPAREPRGARRRRSGPCPRPPDG